MRPSALRFSPKFCSGRARHFSGSPVVSAALSDTAGINGVTNSLNFESLGVSPRLASRLKEFGIATPTETQTLALPPLIRDRADAVLRAETGSGKTLCYLLPILQLVEHRFQHQIRALEDGAKPKDLWNMWSEGLFPAPPELPPRKKFSKAREDRQKLASDIESFFGACALETASGQQEESAVEEALPSAQQRTRPIGATGLVLVPTQELARQVAAVIGDLYPSISPLVRLAYADKGVSRRDICAVVVATPAALAENVNSFQLDNLGMMVLDEADMLLSAGSYQDMTQGFALLKMHKQRSPEARPQTLFCAATVPSRGKRSVAAFLDQYYSEADGVLRISTSGAHRHVQGLIRNTFLQLDAGLPLTLEEKEAQARLAAKVQAHIEEVQANLEKGKIQKIQQQKEAEAAAKGGKGKAAKGKAKGKKAEEEQAAAALAASPLELDTEDSISIQEPEEDRLAVFMAARTDEDRAAQLLADREQYWKRVDSLRKHALLEALLLPLKEDSSTSAGGGGLFSAGPTTDAAGAEAGAGGAASKAARKRKGQSSSSLVFSTSEALNSQGSFTKKTAKAIASGLKTGPTLVAAPPSRPASPSSEPSLSAVAGSEAAGGIVPLRLYENTGLRSRLEIRDLADATGTTCLLPQTLIFFNSADKVEAARKFLNSALPVKEINLNLPPGKRLLRIGALHNRLSDEERANLVRDFHSGDVTVLLCTDVASRGLDTRKVSHVIQAEFAQDAVSYLHRIGRTARAGSKGSVTNLVTRANLDLAQALLTCAAEGKSIDDAFSRNRSFRSRVRKAALTAAEEQVIMAALEAEASEAAEKNNGEVKAVELK